MGHRPQLENLLCKVNEAAPEKPQVIPDEQGPLERVLDPNQKTAAWVRPSHGGRLTVHLFGCRMTRARLGASVPLQPV